MSEACYNASQPVKTNPGVVLDVSVVSGGSSDVNLIELAGNPIDVNIGNSSAGTQRVVLASDQPPIPVSVTFPSTADINLIELAGTPVSVNAGTADNGTLRVVVAIDQSALPVSQFGTWNLNNITGTISLPTGAATEITLAAIKAQTDQLTFSATRLLVDASGTVQPISGTVTVLQGTSPWVISGSVTANAGTNLNTSLLLLDSTFTSRINTLGQKTSANSTPVVIASDQSTLPVSVSNFPATVAVTQSTSPWVVSGTVAATQSGTWNINNISGTISLPTGAATSALQTTGNTSLSSIDGKLNSLGQKTMAGSVPVVIASDQSAIPISGTITANPGTSATSSITRVNTTNTSHQLVALNANRKGLLFYNDSTSQQFIKFGTTASQTDFTIRISTQDYYEVPQPVYTGRIDVIGTNSNGAIQVTELT